MKALIKMFKTSIGYYFYETQRNEIISVSKPLYEYIQKLSDNPGISLSNIDEKTQKEFDELVAYGYLKSPYITEIKHSSTNFLKLMLDRKIDKILLQVTQRCNLRCEYCIYSEHKNLSTRCHSNKEMSFEIAKRAIEFYGEHSLDTDEKVIGFYGGEPLLNFELIKKIIEYSNKYFKGNEIQYTITTNATLLNDDIITFFADNNVTMTISLDGPKAIQDKNRKFPNGEGTYDIVIEKIKRIREKNKKSSPFLINMVIDPDNSYNEIMHILDEPVLKNITVLSNLVEEDEKTKPTSSAYYEQHEKALFIGLISYFRDSKFIAPNRIIKQEIIELERANYEIKRNILSDVEAPSGPCIPGKMRLFTDYSGKFFPCERVSETAECMNIGNVYDGIDMEKVRSLLNIAQITSEECKKCWAFQLCSICAKTAEKEGTLCALKKLEGCHQSKVDAAFKIRFKILISENKLHEKSMRKKGVKK